MNTPSRDISKLPVEAFLRLPDVIALVGLSRASIYAKVAENRFPASIKLTQHASGWRMGDIRAWLADPTGWVHSGISASVTSTSGRGLF